MIVQGKVWGTTSPLFNRNNIELHHLKIMKGGFCSKHMHKFKYNKFVVLEGKLKVTIWKDYGLATLADVSILESSQECTVPPGYYHKFEALEETRALEIYWVELSEDDIVRADHGGAIIDEAKTDALPETNGSHPVLHNHRCPNCNDGSCQNCRWGKAIKSRPATGLYDSSM